MDQIMIENLTASTPKEGLLPPHEAETTSVSDGSTKTDTSGIIKNGTIAAMAAGLVPVPLVGLGGLVSINLVMLNALAKHYGVPFRRNSVKSAVLSLLGSAVPMTVGVGFSEMLKIIPGFGTVAGAAGTSLLAGTITYAIGQAFDHHLASGGNFLDIDMQVLKQQFNASLKHGKEVATQLAARAKSKPATPPAPTE